MPENQLAVEQENVEEINKALADSTKKRKAEDEIEIDLNKSVPLSKKQKRLLRRGKITIEELNAKYNIDTKSIEEYERETADKNGADDSKEEHPDDANSKEDGGEGDTKQQKAKKEKKFGVWIGNLAFETSKEEIIKYIVAKTKENAEESQITENSIVRINMPLAQNDGKRIKNKGFAYVDFKTSAQMDAAVSLSETALNGRNLLIKNAKNFDGRPDKNDLVSLSKNPPSRILFVGNLSFDTTDELLKKHFQHCGEIVKIRMATFEDSGKCKGFAFVDFKDEDGATSALKDKACRKIAGRPIRMEFGEDRSKRQVKRRPVENSSSQRPILDLKETAPPPIKERVRFNNDRKPIHRDSNNRVKSSVALASAQRGSAAIVESKGKKTTFN